MKTILAVIILCLLGLAAVAYFRRPVPSVRYAPLYVSTAAFADHGAIPKLYTCDGQNVNPPLTWSGVPASAKSIVLIVDDPDAPLGTYTHWVVFNIQPTVRNIEEGTAPGMEGKTSFGKIGYGGPCPPTGTHRYFFKVYALDSELKLPTGSSRKEVEEAMITHVVAFGETVGTYAKSLRK